MRSPARYGSPALGMADSRRAGSAPCISAINSSMRAGPSEQLTPATSTPRAARMCATSAGPAPEVGHAVVAERHFGHHRQIGRTARHVATAIASSSRSEKVSSISRSAPASQSTPICSRKDRRSVLLQQPPRGRTRLPNGPTEPAIQTGLPADFPRLARQLDPPEVDLAGPCQPVRTPISRGRLPPNVLVWMTSAPARM